MVWTPLAFSSWVAALIVVASSRKLTVWMPLALTMSRRALERQPDEPDLGAGDGPDLVGREDRLARVLVDDVGGEELEVGTGEAVAVLTAIDRVAAAVLHAQQLVDALVELVVADGGDVETERVQRLDRRLIVECRRDQRAGTDVVAGRDLEGPTGCRRLELLDLRCQVLDAARERRPDDVPRTPSVAGGCRGSR